MTTSPSQYVPSSTTFNKGYAFLANVVYDTSTQLSLDVLGLSVAPRVTHTLSYNVVVEFIEFCGRVCIIL